jgi:hypothetical protein
MDVDGLGAATVRVSSGWVQIEAQNGQQLIPQGMLANTEPNHLVGTAHFESATEAFQHALRAFDFGRLSASEHRDARTILFREARRDDVFTLLQLAQRLTPSERGELYDRAAQLRTPPSGVTRAMIVAGEGDALEAWRRTLGFPEVKRWWLHWTDAFTF